MSISLTDYNLLVERIAALETQMTSAKSGILDNKNGVDTTWIALCTYLIFLMQSGFMILEAGTSRYKNYVSSLIKNLLDICLTTAAWWICGYAFAFGTSNGRFIGSLYFAGDEIKTFDNFNNWLFQWAFAGTSATIVSGGILERVTILGYTIFSTFVTAWIYPLIVHWCWSPTGWLKHMGYHDFAGSGVVHLTGGTMTLCASIIIGPRIGRFDKKEKEDKKRIFHDVGEEDFKPTYEPFIVLGTLILWFCWFGFNCGSTIQISGAAYTDIVGKVGMNTAISGSIGGLTTFFLNYFYVYFTNKEEKYSERYSLPYLCNGILAGLVGITSACDNVASWAAVVIGFISGLIYIGYSRLLIYFKIDDPLDASAIHGGVGTWGVVAVGWFDQTKGILYGKGGKQFGVNLLGMVCIAAWSAFWTIASFLLLKLVNLHRISDHDEFTGIDAKNCGGHAIKYDKYSRMYYSKILNPLYSNKTQKEIFQEIDDEIQKAYEDDIDNKKEQESESKNINP